MLGQRVKDVDVSRFPNGIRKAERSVAETSSRIDDMVSRRRFDLHSLTFEKILSIQECPRDVLFPPLDPDIMVVSSTAAVSSPFGVFDTPARRSRDVRPIFRCVERKAHVQMAEHPEENQLVVQRSGCFVLQQLTRAKEMFDILQQECEVGGVVIGKERVRRLIAIALGVEIVWFEIVHQLEHANQQFVEPALVGVGIPSRFLVPAARMDILE